MTALASFAAGVGGLTGMLLGITVTGHFEDYFQSGVGFDASWFQLLVTPAGAHVLGAAFRQVVRRSGATAPQYPSPMA